MKNKLYTQLLYTSLFTKPHKKNAQPSLAIIHNTHAHTHTKTNTHAQTNKRTA